MQNDRRPKQCTAQVQTNAGVHEHHRGRKVIKRHGLDDASRRAPAFAVSCLPTCDGQANKAAPAIRPATKPVGVSSGTPSNAETATVGTISKPRPATASITAAMMSSSFMEF
jgi:hypothetical protein